MQESIITTLGHIDHGKSSLVWALCGTDPDRFAEEKKRGITLDLGYGFFDQGDQRIALVDVPGHEDLIKNMLSGLGGIQGALMVVAADQGLMPQSREHFQIASLLGLKGGVIALTRVDLSEPETLAMVIEEVEEFIQGSFLEAAPIITCSTKTGAGIEKVRAALLALPRSSSPSHSPFIMPIDRSFSLKGFGFIAAGNVAQGAFSVSDELQLYPDQTQVKIRGMQSQQAPITEANSGMRVALNIKNISTQEAPRGKILASPQALLVTTETWVEVKWLKVTKDKLKSRHPLSLFVNGQETQGVVRRSKEWPEGLWHVSFKKPLALKFQDIIILRNFSLNETWGGATVLTLHSIKDLKDKASARSQIASLNSCSVKERFELVTALSGANGLLTNEITAQTGASKKEIATAIKDLQAKRTILTTKDSQAKYYHKSQLKLWGGYCSKILKEFHQKQPEIIGVKAEYFFGKFPKNCGQKEIAEILDWLAKAKFFEKTELLFHMADFHGQMPVNLKKAKSDVLGSLKELGFKCLNEQKLKDLTQLNTKDLKRLTLLAVEEKWLLRTKEKYFFSAQAIDQAWANLEEYFHEHKEITVITFKERLHLSRKEAVLILELFDEQGKTQRAGDLRSLR
ncbi:MAG: selenocysteine-specific translation elongation factor [SAR324 cluster bacterium]|nr:selenocysteine-specific translation elongation factor [SAR324 cluster bacterium]